MALYRETARRCDCVRCPCHVLLKPRERVVCTPCKAGAHQSWTTGRRLKPRPMDRARDRG